MGTGGTLAGVSIGLKDKNKNIKIALSDPMGSSLYSYVTNRKLESSGSSITEGIGTARITKNFDKALVDEAFQTNDTEALNIVFNLIENQKIFLGGSSGINIGGAIKLAKNLGPGKTIVTILCDHGRRYASKIFNKEFLKDKNSLIILTTTNLRSHSVPSYQKFYYTVQKITVVTQAIIIRHDDWLLSSIYFA